MSLRQLEYIWRFQSYRVYGWRLNPQTQSGGPLLCLGSIPAAQSIHGASLQGADPWRGLAESRCSSGIGYMPHMIYMFEPPIGIFPLATAAICCHELLPACNLQRQSSLFGKLRQTSSMLHLFAICFLRRLCFWLFVRSVLSSSSGGDFP